MKRFVTEVTPISVSGTALAAGVLVSIVQMKNRGLAPCRSRRQTAEAERGIELLQERGTALISAAVTGKIDVREISSLEAVT